MIIYQKNITNAYKNFTLYYPTKNKTKIIPDC